MIKYIKYAALTAVLSLFTVTVSAQQSGGGDDLKGVCELSGGQWTGVESGNWACCWPDWGCYGCVSSQCKMKCNTERCRKANGMLSTGTDSTGTIKLKALVPAGSMAPAVPKPVKPQTQKSPAINKVQ